jgi:WD40 repeat protein
MSENRVVHWNAATRRATTALDLEGGGGGGPTNHGRRDDETRDDARDNGARSGRGEAFFDDDDFFSENETSDETSDGRLRDSGSGFNRGDGGGASFALSTNFPRIQVSTTCARDSLVAAGGFAGELVVLDVDTGVSASTRVTRDDNGITNAVDFFSTPGGAEALVCSNNDKATRWYDIATMKCVARHEYPWAVNYTAVGRDGTLAAVVGDTKEAWVVDTRSGKLVQTCEGHLDFSFAAAWHPDGVRFATGNQDTTARVWDIRHTGQSLAVLRGKMGAVRSLRFSSDGAFLAAAEPADFVHLYDVNSGFTKKQTLDHFGETAGVSFSPCGEALFVGVADLTYGSVLEFERSRWGHGAPAIA